MKREVLKSLALKAKNRMIHKSQNDNFGLGLEGNDLHIKIISSSDDLFYSKVRSLLEDDQDIMNPIKQLMDENLMMKLDPRGREKYLLDTVEKYHKFRKMIESDRALSESV